MKRKPCTVCGTDPKGDLHPRQGELCFWCAELNDAKDVANKALLAKLRTPNPTGYSGGDLGPMFVRRGTNSTGPRRAPPIPTRRVRQHHNYVTLWNWMYLLIGICYVVFMVVWMRMSA